VLAARALEEPDQHRHPERSALGGERGNSRRAGRADLCRPWRGFSLVANQTRRCRLEGGATKRPRIPGRSPSKLPSELRASRASRRYVPAA